MFLVLAKKGDLMDLTFLDRLKELNYWNEPAYTKYLRFPICLAFLELLQRQSFRVDLGNELFVSYLHHALFPGQIKSEQHTLPDISMPQERIKYESCIARWDRYTAEINRIQRAVLAVEIGLPNPDITRWYTYPEVNVELPEKN